MLRQVANSAADHYNYAVTQRWKSFRFCEIRSKFNLGRTAVRQCRIKLNLWRGARNSGLGGMQLVESCAETCCVVGIAVKNFFLIILRFDPKSSKFDHIEQLLAILSNTNLLIRPLYEPNLDDMLKQISGLPVVT